MNNYQWLLQMDGADRKAWFDAEHVEHQERALDGDTDAQNEPYLFGMPLDEVLGKLRQVDELETEREALKRRTLQLELHIEQLRSKLSRACDNAHDTLRIMDEGMA